MSSGGLHPEAGGARNPVAMKTFSPSLKQKLIEALTLLDELESRIEGLPEIPRQELMSRLERARIIARAFARDLEDIGNEGVGADRETVEALGALLDSRVNRLRQEVAFLDQGNPTTVDVVGDAAIEKVSEVVEKAGRLVDTAKVTLKTARVKLRAVAG